MNREMVARYTPALADPVIPVGAPYDDGSAITLGHSAGGALRHMDGAFMSVHQLPTIGAPQGHPREQRGEAVRRRGLVPRAHERRVCRATGRCGVPHRRRGDVRIPRSSSRCHSSTDGRSSRTPRVALGLPDRSLAGDRRRLQRARARNGEDADFHKHPDWLQPLDHAPYAAFDASLGHGIYVGFTVGRPPGVARR